MENASKALIIAGAILISILLISVGILVMNSTGTVTDTMGEEMDSAAIQSFNSKFTNYAGQQKGSTIKTLMTTIESSNASSEHQVKVDGTLGSTTSAVSAAAKSTTTYTVTITDSDSDGYYDTVTIS